MADAQAYLALLLNEQYAQARQHEQLRHQSTALVLSVVGATVTLVTASATLLLKDLQGARLVWPLLFYLVAGAFVAAMGKFGSALSFKHYERNRMHVQRARQLRSELDRLTGMATAEFSAVAKAKHKERWIKDHGERNATVINRRTYQYWRDIYLCPCDGARGVDCRLVGHRNSGRRFVDRPTQRACVGPPNRPFCRSGRSLNPQGN